MGAGSAFTFHPPPRPSHHSFTPQQCSGWEGEQQPPGQDGTREGRCVQSNCPRQWDLGSRPAFRPWLAISARAALLAYGGPGQYLGCTLFSFNHNFLMTQLIHLCLTHSQQPTACPVEGSDCLENSGVMKTTKNVPLPKPTATCCYTALSKQGNLKRLVLYLSLRKAQYTGFRAP